MWLWVFLGLSRVFNGLQERVGCCRKVQETLKYIESYRSI